MTPAQRRVRLDFFCYTAMWLYIEAATLLIAVKLDSIWFMVAVATVTRFVTVAVVENYYDYRHVFRCHGEVRRQALAHRFGPHITWRCSKLTS